MTQTPNQPQNDEEAAAQYLRAHYGKNMTPDMAGLWARLGEKDKEIQMGEGLEAHVEAAREHYPKILQQPEPEGEPAPLTPRTGEFPIVETPETNKNPAKPKEIIDDLAIIDPPPPSNP